MLKLRKYGHWYLLAALALAAVLIWQAIFWVEARRKLVLVYFFDVGQGDAIFIEAPNGNQVLIDGGPDRSVLAELGGAMPFWDRSIDLVILTHPHADHLGGLLEVVKNYDIDMVMESGVNHSIPEYGQWHQLLSNKDLRVATAEAGQKINLSDSVFLEVLAPLASYKGQSPKNVHEAMIVLKFVHGATEVLLMGDAERRLERKLMTSVADLRADILKVGHHGSKTSTAEEFLRSTRPRLAVISSGRNNRYGHPHQEVLDRLTSFGVEIYRTDQDGTLTLVSDGKIFRRR